MDAKSKANFINAVASGTTVPCPKCGAANQADSEFCISCGAELPAPQEAQKDTPVFEPSKESAPTKTVEYVEPDNAFAQGLPDWSLEPPQVMVRRH